MGESDSEDAGVGGWVGDCAQEETKMGGWRDRGVRGSMCTLGNAKQGSKRLA